MNTTTVSSLGTKVPFRRSPETPAPIAASVRGTIPSWLRGDLVRTCPAVFETSGWRAEHWFDAIGMIYAFEVNGPQAIAFRSRVLQCEAANDPGMGSFGTPIARSLWKRLLEPVPRVTDNANVNIVKIGDDLVAMTESDKQVVVDPRDFSTRGRVVYDDNVLRGGFMSAHPHFDFERKQVVNVATQLGASAVVSIYEHGPNERTRRVIGSWKSRRAPYIHAFGLTPENAILIAHPFSASPASLLWSNRGFIDHFSWRPEEGTRLVVIDRKTGASREHVTDPFFVFHTVNAFEKDGATVLDVLAYDDAAVIAALRVDALAQNLPDLRPSLVRLTMRPGQERATAEKLSDVGFEFPGISYRKYNGREYRFAFGASDGPGSRTSGYSSDLVKIDIATGRAATYGDDEHVFGEPIFVARPGATAEDDGVLVSVGSHRREDRSQLVIVDASTMSLVASADVPRAIPLGFHGSFVRA